MFLYTAYLTKYKDKYLYGSYAPEIDRNGMLYYVSKTSLSVLNDHIMK
jgi:hypothetical protein